jgi:2,4-dienoyl-CoA reductase-like NADH-dependent reductase (Old Yellow Enzyme family)/thioredoxin reductase
MSMKFINQPLHKGALDLKNRFVMPPMVINYATHEGFMTEKMIAYYAARAEGGVGLIIVECTAVSPEGRGFSNGLCLYDDSYIPPLAKLAQTAHYYGAKILIQIGHAGRRTGAQYTGSQPVAPSSIPLFGSVPRELTVEEIKIIERKFLEAARRAYKAGFDGVEIHGAHGYLIHQFLSPITNHRSDEYGGDFNGRAKFLIEILDDVKQEVPSDFIIGCRLNGEDYVEGGLHIEDTKRIASQLTSHEVSYLHVSCGTAESLHMSIAPMDMEPGFLVPLSEAIKKTVSVPVIAVGRIIDPLQADAIIGEGKADLVAMGRALWADPQLPRKALGGRLGEIRPCIGCNQGCRRRVDRCCTMNPETHREKELAMYPAERPKRVLVIGGGPAGLECARVARMRGHEVILVEKSSKLGGNFRLAAIPPKRGDIQKGIQFFENEILRLDIQVKLGEKATPEDVERYNPDVVVIATGAIPIIPSIPGIEQDNLISAEDVLLQKRPVGERVLVIGGGLVGSEAADFLSGKGKDVVLVEMLSDIALDMDPPSTTFLRERLQKQGVKVWLSWKVTKICDDKVIVEKDGEEKTIEPIDSVVFAVGYKFSTELTEKMKSTSFGVHVVGDASKPRDALAAIFEGSKIAREI